MGNHQQNRKALVLLKGFDRAKHFESTVSKSLIDGDKRHQLILLSQVHHKKSVGDRMWIYIILMEHALLWL